MVSAVPCEHELQLLVKLLDDFHKLYNCKLTTKTWRQVTCHLYVTMQMSR